MTSAHSRRFVDTFVGRSYYCAFSSCLARRRVSCHRRSSLKYPRGFGSVSGRSLLVNPVILLVSRRPLFFVRLYSATLRPLLKALGSQTGRVHGHLMRCAGARSHSPQLSVDPARSAARQETKRFSCAHQLRYCLRRGRANNERQSYTTRNTMRAPRVPRRSSPFVPTLKRNHLSASNSHEVKMHGPNR